jgi:type IV secretory pathway ATPase VirB11/archaellum biosynthesis ATPase
MPEKRKQTAPVRNVDDFTTYAPTNTIADTNQLNLFHSEACQIEITDNQNSRYTVIGRGLTCKAYQGQYLSITVRSDNSTRKCAGFSEELKPDEDYKPKYRPKPSSPEKPDLPISIDTVCNLLREILSRLLIDSAHPRGVVVITGSTSSGKSQIARGLIYKLLDHVRTKEPDTVQADERVTVINRTTNASTIHYVRRRPHLLTIEDPIEAFFLERETDKSCHPIECQAWGIDYTPREIGTDVSSVDAALQDALRQTPSVVYIGETRRMDQWKTVIDFAGTGHLVVTTAHAGSLTEAMDRILQANDANTPVRRGQVAETILAIIHMKSYSFEGTVNGHTIGQSALVPAVWRNTPGAVSALVGDGLASILPNHFAGTPPEDVGSISRTWFVEQYKLAEKASENLRKQVMRDDLRGI